MTAAGTIKTGIVSAAARGLIPRRWCPVILRVLGLTHA
ncbi:hypothetical protein SAMN05421720_101353 [Rhodospira trueperi]|uniref:Uncharacterized protein n=1 Tax=Rhodospira trueperi TaxID=69960 RepID=A0A1G6X2T9_9PROT|nr:hypothetical protein SAMN05421720_101353 [Rhodospira trueperi]